MHTTSRGTTTVPQVFGLGFREFGLDDSTAWSPWLFGLERRCFAWGRRNGVITHQRFEYRIAEDFDR